MNFFIQRSELRDLYDKVVAGERLPTGLATVKVRP